MWGLFTRALTLASSTVRVSIINTSANFIVTAVLSFIIFSENLPGLWWVGASLLVTGSVIIGRREEPEKKKESAATTGETPLLDTDQSVGYRDDNPEDDDILELGSVKFGEGESSDEDKTQRELV